ncbi:MAG: acyl-CoA thioesterase [Pseudomonadota bacterium]|nr:acyl-CoA thioesterase [Pseudomonadota bacterium]
MTATETLITAQFYDLDPMGVVWHGNYPRFFEQARCELLDCIGYNYREMETSGYIWPIVDLQVKFVRPIRFAQTFVVKATILESANRLKIGYVICDSVTREVLTKAHTVQVAVEAATGELCLECPSALTDKLKDIS